ncbi:MAG: hypothetical protein IJT24_01310 [Lachnospiraceae bacterium]|nr:hypothetical protein [Lachnospiraceae bacterium]
MEDLRLLKNVELEGISGGTEDTNPVEGKDRPGNLTANESTVGKDRPGIMRAETGNGTVELIRPEKD